MTVIHEVQQMLWVNTPHGEGQVLFIFDYGPHENSVFLVALKNNGKLNHYNTTDVTLSINYTFSMNTSDSLKNK